MPCGPPSQSIIPGWLPRASYLGYVGSGRSTRGSLIFRRQLSTDRQDVARGRDAADIPVINSFGPHVLKSFRVWTYEVFDTPTSAYPCLKAQLRATSGMGPRLRG